MKIESYKPVFVTPIPHEIEPGIMYVSEEFGICMFLCPCGCGEKIPIPFGPDKPDPEHTWDFTKNGDVITLSPSILMLAGCKSHYFIREGKVVWT